MVVRISTEFCNEFLRSFDWDVDEDPDNYEIYEDVLDDYESEIYSWDNRDDR